MRCYTAFYTFRSSRKSLIVFGSFGDFAMRVSFTKKGSFQEFWARHTGCTRSEFGTHAFSDRRVLYESPLEIVFSASLCLAHHERRSFGSTGHLFGFDICASPVLACSIRWSSILITCINNTLDYDLEEQEMELADHICSICDDFDTPEFKMLISINSAISVCNWHCFPADSPLRGVPASAKLIRFTRIVSRRGVEVNARTSCLISTTSATKCSLRGTLSRALRWRTSNHNAIRVLPDCNSAVILGACDGMILIFV
jgi:hypothetical protein